MTKKQLLPLLAIALVVAILSTGVFYGLVATKMSGPPARQAAVAARDPAQKSSNDGEADVPLGMRAISIHVSDSSGVVALLRRGQRVDVQVVHRADSRSSKETTVRTIVQNLEVLAAESRSQSPEGRGGAPPVVTLVATPEEADILGLADSAEQVRLLLRHPEDSEVTRRTSVGAASLFGVTSSGGRSSAKHREETGRRVLAQR